MNEDVKEGALLPRSVLNGFKGSLVLSTLLLLASGFVGDAQSRSILQDLAQIALGLGMAGLMADRAWGTQRTLRDPVFADRQARERSKLTRDGLGLWPDDRLMASTIVSWLFVAVGVLLVVLGFRALLLAI